MNGLLHQDILAHLPRLPRLAGAFARLRARPQPQMPLYRSEGFGEDLEAFDVGYRPRATIIRRQTGAAEERKQ